MTADPTTLSITPELARRLLELRKANQLTQDAIAAALGVSRTQVSRIELGQVSPEVAQVDAWARRCGTTLQRVLPAEPQDWRTDFVRGVAASVRYDVDGSGASLAELQGHVRGALDVAMARAAAADELMSDINNSLGLPAEVDDSEVLRAIEELRLQARRPVAEKAEGSDAQLRIQAFVVRHLLDELDEMHQVLATPALGRKLRVLRALLLGEVRDV